MTQATWNVIHVSSNTIVPNTEKDSMTAAEMTCIDLSRIYGVSVTAFEPKLLTQAEIDEMPVWVYSGRVR